MKQIVIGHRGASAYAPENTMAAFQKAQDMGCRFIEFDVMLSVDDELVVFHDETLERTTNGRGKVALATLDYLRSLEAGRWVSKTFAGEKIPSLQETIAWLSASSMHANIEIKPDKARIHETTAAVLSEITRYWPHNKSAPLVSSFEREALVLCRSLAPELPLGALIDTWEETAVQFARELQAYSVHLNQRIVTEKRVATLKEEGFVVYVYTVNKRRQAKTFFQWGVDAVFSDYPDLMNKTSRFLWW